MEKQSIPQQKQQQQPQKVQKHIQTNEKHQQNYKKQNNLKQQQQQQEEQAYVPMTKEEKQALINFRKSLPIFKHRESIIENFKKNKVTIVAGETGCGKTTQIPQYLLEEQFNNGKLIAVTQPRRVAAITIAQRVAQEKNTQIGNLVGYSVRFEEKFTKDKTKLMYMTDGMLLRECIVDKQLSRFSVIIIDEAHERIINSDILLSMLKDILNSRDDLKIIIMSATIETEKFANFYGSDNIIFLEGRCHPIDLYYTREPQADYVESAVNTVMQIHMNEPVEGDILVFLCGKEDIDDMLQMLNQKIKQLNEKNYEKSLAVLPLYSALPSHLQLLAFQKQTEKNTRKVILSTNIAETSVTIDGIRYVVDNGLVKVRKYDPVKLLEQLIVIPISKSSALQRAGRAGRQYAGKCYRLYTENALGTLAEYMAPEILRSNLSAVILQMKAIGIDSISNFDFLDKPNAENLKSSIKILQQLGALNAQEQLTAHGKEMAELPLDPNLSNFLLSSLQNNCTQEVVSSISILSVENLFYFPQDQRKSLLKILKRFQVGQSDHLTKVNILYQYMESKNKKSFCKENFINKKTVVKAIQVRQQLMDYIKQIIEKRLKKLHNAASNIKNPLEKQIQIEKVQKSKEAFNSLLKFSSKIHEEEFSKCLAKSMFLKIAKENIDGSYTILRTNQKAYIHPESLLFYQKPKPQCITFNEVVFTTKTYLRDITEISLADANSQQQQ